MSQKKVNLGFINKIISITPTIDTVLEGTASYIPTAGKEYQELYYLPAINDSQNIDNPDYFNRGIFQITLKYPNKQGLSKILDKCDLYVNAFAKSTKYVYVNVLQKGSKFTFQGLTIAITETPTIVNLGNERDRVVYAISINYKAYVDLL